MEYKISRGYRSRRQSFDATLHTFSEATIYRRYLNIYLLWPFSSLSLFIHKIDILDDQSMIDLIFTIDSSIVVTRNYILGRRRNL